MKRFALAVRLAPATAAALTLLAAAAAPAQAATDIRWDVTGAFDDGGKLSGFFDVDKFGVMFDWDLKTTTVGPFTGFEYIRTPPPNGTANSGGDNSETAIALKKVPDAFFRLGFTSSLFTLSKHNALNVGGDVSPSFECVDSFSCFQNDGHGTSRHLVSGFAVGTPTTIGGDTGGGGASGTPEPAAWTMMLLGFGGIGAALRGARRRMAPAA
jgi:hypothetical protein